MATIKDVARVAGVSISTVSKYINGGSLRPEKASAVHSAISSLGYRVNPCARNLKTRKIRAVGILLPNITAPFFGSVLTSVDKILREKGFHTLISCYGSNLGLERSNLNFLVRSGVEGIIYAPEDLSEEEYYEIIKNNDIPVVQIDRVIQGVNTDTVLVDNSDSVYMAVRSLADKGHRRIGCICGPKSVHTARERLVGYLRALSDCNIIYDDEMVISGENEFATGYRACKAMMQSAQPPSAIVTTNYDITVGLITAAREMGLSIPKKIDVFGFDCMEICTMMEPALPVVHQPEQEIGQKAAAYLIERMEGYKGPARTAQLKCELIGM